MRLFARESRPNCQGWWSLRKIEHSISWVVERKPIIISRSKMNGLCKTLWYRTHVTNGISWVRWNPLSSAFISGMIRSGDKKYTNAFCWYCYDCRNSISAKLSSPWWSAIVQVSYVADSQPDSQFRHTRKRIHQAAWSERRRFCWYGRMAAVRISELRNKCGSHAKFLRLWRSVMRYFYYNAIKFNTFVRHARGIAALLWWCYQKRWGDREKSERAQEQFRV